MIRSIIFDLDGTLIQSLPGIATSLNRTLTQHGFPNHSEAAVRGFIGNGMRKLIERALPEDAQQTELLDDMVADLSKDYSSTWPDGTAPYANVLEVLTQLTSMEVSLSVLSNKPDIFCRRITDTLFPHINFHTVQGQKPDVAAKPNPEGAFLIARQLSLDPSEIALLGDSTIDLETAQNANMTPLAACWGYHDEPALRGTGAGAFFSNIDELIPWIER